MTGCWYTRSAMTRRIFAASALTIAFITVSGCKKQNDPGIPYGPMTATGILIRADVSLIRRGSHALVIGEKTVFYVESRTQNLSDFEGLTVNVSGTLEKNADEADLPVLVAESMKGPTENEDMRRFEAPFLNLRLGVPESWKGSIKDGTASFRLEGEAEPLMTIRQMSGTTLPPGNPLFIKNRRTTRLDTEQGSDLYILEKATVIHIHFDAATQKQLTTKEEADIVTAQFQRVLSAISFITDREAATPSTSSGSSTVCGGVAGIVCEAGFFCNITDFETRIGICKRL